MGDIHYGILLIMSSVFLGGIAYLIREVNSIATEVGEIKNVLSQTDEIDLLREIRDSLYELSEIEKNTRSLRPPDPYNHAP
jgi:hypothetical protein